MSGQQVLNTLSKDAGVMPEIKGTKFETTLKNNPNKKYTETELNILYNDTVPQSYVTTFTTKALMNGAILPGRYKDAGVDTALFDRLNRYRNSQLLPNTTDAALDNGTTVFSVGEKAFFYPSAAARESGDLNNAIRLQGLQGLIDHRYYDDVPGYYGHIRFQVTENYDGGVDFAKTANVGEIQSDIVKGYSAFAANQDKNGVLSAVKDANAGITGNRVYLTGEVQDAVDELLEIRRPVSDITPSNAEETAALTTAQTMVAERGQLDEVVRQSNYYGQSTLATPEQSKAWTKRQIEEQLSPEELSMFDDPNRAFAEELDRYIELRVADRLFEAPVSGSKIKQFAEDQRLDVLPEFEDGGMYEGLHMFSLNPHKGLGNTLQNNFSPNFLRDPEVQAEIKAIVDEVALEAEELAKVYNIPKEVLDDAVSVKKRDYADFNYEQTDLVEPINRTFRKYVATGRLGADYSAHPNTSELGDIFDRYQSLENYEMTTSTASPQTQKIVADYLDAEKKVQQSIQALPPQRAELLRELQTTLAKTVRSDGSEGFIFAPPFKNQQQFFEHATKVFPKEMQGAELGYGSSPIKYVNFPNYVDIAEARELDPDLFKSTYQGSVNKGLQSLVKNVPDAMVGPEGTSGLDLMQTSQGLEALGGFRQGMLSDAPPSLRLGNYPSQILNISPGSKIGEALKKPLRRAKGGPVDLRTGIGDLFRLYS